MAEFEWVTKDGIRYHRPKGSRKKWQDSQGNIVDLSIGKVRLIKKAPKTSAVGEFLNSAGEKWNHFWDLDMTILSVGSPYEAVARAQDGKTAYNTYTLRRGDVAKEVAAAVTVPALAASTAAVGVPATVGGLVAGTIGSELGGTAGSKAVELAGGTTDFARDLGLNSGEILGGIIGGTAGTKGTIAFNDFGKYHGFGNLRLNNWFDFMTAKKFLTGRTPAVYSDDGTIMRSRTTITDPKGNTSPEFASGGESTVFNDPQNAEFVLKKSEPFVVREGLKSSSGFKEGLRLRMMGIDFVTDFNSPGRIVQPIRYAGYTPDGSLVVRQTKVTPFSETGLDNSAMRQLFYHATKGMPEVNRYFTDEALAKYGNPEIRKFYQGEAPIWSDIRESNIGLTKDGRPVIFDYVANKDGRIAGSWQTFNNAQTINRAINKGIPYSFTKDGDIVLSAKPSAVVAKKASMDFREPKINWSNVKKMFADFVPEQPALPESFSPTHISTPKSIEEASYEELPLSLGQPFTSSIISENK